ncbi:MAG: TonB family protein [Campylobacteraceae bacterium]|nr:TonB family protein [Campylobacteraceae bacterium]
MKNIVYAVIISLFIHLLFLLVLQEENIAPIKNIVKETPKKQHITYVKLKKVVPIKKIIEKRIEKKKDDLTVDLTKKAIKKTSLKINSEKTTKKSKLKKVNKEKFVKTKKRDVVKKPKNIVAKAKVKTVVKPKIIKKKKTLVLKKPIPKPIKTPLPKTKQVKENKSLDLLSKTLQENTLESFLSTPNLNENTVDKITQRYLKLYGDEFKSFTKVQKVFLKRNLKSIISVTRMYMRFPEVLLRKKHGGELILEFLLYPNGDIGSILLTSSSGYTSLDKGAINTIEIAYPEYPKPRVTTKIKLKMIYIYN